MPAVVLQYYTAVGHGGARGRVRASAPCPRDTHWHCRQWHRHTPTATISPPGSWAPQLPRSPVATTMERTATVVLFALFDSVPASGNVVGLYMLPLPPICIACYSSTSSVICTVLMAWHWQVLDARRWRMERRRRSARFGSNQTGQACSSTSTHGTEVRNKERKKNP